MVIPGWRYLVSGGTTGQALTKISGADGDYQWSTVAAVPGGSDTQIQYNNAGVIAGSPYLKYATGASSPYGKLFVTTVGTGEDSAIALQSSRASTTQQWFFGTGDGGSNTNPFRIYNLTASKEPVRVEIDGTIKFIDALITLVPAASVGGPFYSKLILTTSGTGEDTAIGLQSTRASTTQRWFFGTGDGGSNTNHFRIYDLTGSIEALRITPATGAIAAVGDIETTTVGKGFILKSPDGTRWRLAVSNAGVVSAGAA